MPSSCFTKLTIFIAMGGFLQTLPALAEAEELKPGFSIDKNNLQEVSEKTFEGKKVGDMLPDAVRDMIKLV
jgi:aldehyde:ferredoxin oxidoreductase